MAGKFVPGAVPGTSDGVSRRSDPANCESLRLETPSDVHFQPEFGDDLGVCHVRDVDELRITEGGRPSHARGRPTARAAGAARLVRADEVWVPLDLHGDHRFGSPLILPEELADNPDLRIGETELIVADVLDHQPVCFPGEGETAGLPHERQRPSGDAGQEAIRDEV